MNAENPKESARRLSAPALAKGYQPEALHEYRDANGEPVLWRIRLRHPETGEKWMRPMHWNGSTYALGEPPAPAEGRPLYRLPELLAADPQAPVFVVEGEKCADALARLGLIATTSGSASSADGADWRPVQGRNVILWPDHDDAGRKYADAVRARLSGLGAPCECLDVAALGLSEKGDAVDWIVAHPEATAAEVLALPRAVQVEREGDGVRLLCMADVEMRPVDWLWSGWLARGKLHILAGSPGTGKTTIALALAATVSTGGRWPDGERCNGGKPAHVLVWSGEDDPADTIAPRLAAAGADLARVHAIQSVRIGGESIAFDPAEHLPELAARIAELGDVGLLIVDPIVSAVAGDGHKNGDVRRGLEPLVRLGQDFGCAVLGISHFSKGTGGKDPTERVTGSIAFGALARVVLGTVKPKEEGAPRLLVRTKANIGPDSGGFAYDLRQEEVAPGFPASRVVWGEAVEGSARDLIGEAEGSDGERSATDEAEEWLRGELDAGPRPASDVQKSARAAGLSDKALRTARARLGVKPVKSGFGGGWTWGLPVEDAQGARRCPHSESGHLGRVEGIFGANEGESEVFDL